MPSRVRKHLYVPGWFGQNLDLNLFDSQLEPQCLNHAMEERFAHGAAFGGQREADPHCEPVGLDGIDKTERDHVDSQFRVVDVLQDRKSVV